MSTKTLAAAGILIALLSTTASATPIAFDFTGVVQRQAVYDHGTFTEDLSQQGQSFTARLVLDTSLLTLSDLSSNPTGRTHWQSTGFLASPSELSIQINGAAVPIPLYELNQLDVTAVDGELAPGCPGCAAGDSVSVFWRSQQVPMAFSQQLASTFAFSAWEASPNDVSPAYIDLDTPFDLESLLTLALPNLSLQFGTTIFDCQDVNLCFTGYYENTWFTPTSVVRTDLSQVQSVPEPGTLSLLVAGLLGVGFTRRRRRAAS